MEPNDVSSLLNSNPNNCVKSGLRILNSAFVPRNCNEDGVKNVKSESLTTKNAIKYLLEGRLKKLVCRYCLNVTSPLSELDQVLQIAGEGVLYKITIKDMVASFRPYKVCCLFLYNVILLLLKMLIFMTTFWSYFFQSIKYIFIAKP